MSADTANITRHFCWALLLKISQTWCMLMKLSADLQGNYLIGLNPSHGGVEWFGLSEYFKKTSSAEVGCLTPLGSRGRNCSGFQVLHYISADSCICGFHSRLGCWQDGCLYLRCYKPFPGLVFLFCTCEKVVTPGPTPWPLPPIHHPTLTPGPARGGYLTGRSGGVPPH